MLDGRRTNRSCLLPFSTRRVTCLSHSSVSPFNLRLSSFRPILTIVIVALLAVAALSAAVVYGNILSHRTVGSGPSCSSVASTKSATGFAASDRNATSANFLIVESDSSPFEGMNGSYFHTFPSSAGYAGYNASLQYWPIIQVWQGQTVTITVMNCASSEPHGFAIGSYFNSGVTLSTGQSYVLTFVASHAGRFSMYCNILCAIHPYMQNGLLIVS
jgi:FtsP/CotA-like multicopper oxidase with cupredoxin domain